MSNRNRIVDAGWFRWVPVALICAVLVVVVFQTSVAAHPQIQVRRAAPFQIQQGIFARRPQVASFDDDEATEVEGGGVVKTDPDLESIMQKADRYRKDGNYRVATQLWQAVLERSGDALFSSDGQTYFSMIRQVEEVIAKLPPKGLAMYRVVADAKAKEILAKAGDPNDVQALSNIVRRYFLSSEGDDAAFRLGCIYLDEYDFIGARRLFEKVASQYPDPSISMADVHARIALCETFLGDFESAKESISVASDVDSRHRSTKAVAEELTKIEKGETSLSISHSMKSEGDWLMPLAGPERLGVGASVSSAMMEQDLVAMWQYSFDPKDRFVRASDTVGRVMSGPDAADEKKVESRATERERKSLKKWQEKFWRPTGHLLFQGDLVYFKSGADLTAWKRSKVVSAAEKAGAKIEDSIGWRSVQRNIFEVDNATLSAQSILSNYGNLGGSNRTDPDAPKPFVATDVQLFGDRIHSQMSIHNGLVFNIEGSAFDERYNQVPKRVVPVWNQPYRRSRVNKLVAYKADTGVVQWRLPRAPINKDAKKGFSEEEEPEWLDDGGFMGSPIGFGNTVIAPVNRGGAIWIYSFDLSKKGKTVWKAFLCDEPEAGAEAWSAINLSIDGSDLFVTCGMGVVFVVDPATGTIRIAKRYTRYGKTDPFYRQSGWTTKRAVFSGWNSDVVIPYGRQAICFASDTQVIEAFDRNDGSTIWRCEINPIGFKVDYLLGVFDNKLFAAGKETIVAYDLEGEGRMLWGADQIFDDKQSLGRGWLTPEGIYMPVQDKIYHFDLEGNLVGKVHVDLGGPPVGNLYSDGERFWVHNGNRLYVLGAKPE